jgi:hypothetical protein
LRFAVSGGWRAHGVLAERLAEACRVIAVLTAQAHAQAANLVLGHHVPVYRAALLLCELAGITVSAGWMAIRGISRLCALRDLFNGHPWMPPGLPAGRIARHGRSTRHGPGP